MSDNGKTSDIKAALSTVADVENKDKDIYTLSTGVRVRLLPVSALLIQSAMSRIKDPPVPIVKDEEQGREYDNPSDPAYLEALAQASLDRGYARLNTIILWGVELIDDMPEDDTWLEKLKLMDKQRIIDLSDFDFENPLEKEFAYKKFIAIGDKLDSNGANVDLTLISNRGMVSEEAIEQASDSFQSDTEQRTDQERVPEKSEVISE